MLLSKTPFIITSVVSGIAHAAPRSASMTERSVTLPFTDQQACGDIASLVAGKNITEVTIPASIAWECLQSVPIDVDSAVEWLETLKPYVNWHCTLAYLADPPEGYVQPAIDIRAQLESIISDTKAGKYSNEYSLEFDLYQTFMNVHDNHFYYLPNLIGNVLSFGRPVTLVSATTNYNYGLPKQYVYGDVLLSSTNSSFEPSAITYIDGTDVLTYLEALSELGPMTDPDALWNSVFASPASLSLSSIGFTPGPGFFAGFGGGQFLYPGDNTTLTFENGTTTVFENFARLLQDFTNISSGEDVFKNYLTPSRQIIGTYHAPPNIDRIPGYPVPVVIQSQGLASGYYLDGEEYRDVAILSIPTFNAFDFLPSQNTTVNFTDATYGFIDKAKADGKTKLIIDLSANGGGLINQGYSLFIKLFPDLLPYLGQRIRATESVDLIGQAISRKIDELGGDPLSNFTEYQKFSILFSTPLNYQEDLDEDYQPFPSWPAKFGPHTIHGDNFSSIFRFNASYFSLYDNTTATGRPFKAEDIVLVSDGACASTCSILTELLTRQAGVQTIAVGGRPSYGPMQALGATKGANDYGWSTIFTLVNSTRGLYSDQAIFNATVLGEYSQLPFERGLEYSNSINFRDQLREGDESQTPLQFVYEPADCRIWNTLAMSVDVTATWKAAYDVAWNGQRCIDGNLSAGKNRALMDRHVVGKRESMSVLSEEEATLLLKSTNVWQDQRHTKPLGAVR